MSRDTSQFTSSRFPSMFPGFALDQYPPKCYGINDLICFNLEVFMGRSSTTVYENRMTPSLLMIIPSVHQLYMFLLCSFQFRRDIKTDAFASHVPQNSVFHQNDPRSLHLISIRLKRLKSIQFSFSQSSTCTVHHFGIVHPQSRERKYSVTGSQNHFTFDWV